MGCDVRLSITQTNTYPSEGYVATKEDIVVEKDGRSWKNVTYTKEHSTCWKVLMGTAAFFATLGTFVIGAFLIDGIKKLWERACSGKEVVIVAIEQKNLNDEQQKVATKGQEVLEVETPKSLETKIHTEEDLRKHFSKDNPMLKLPRFIDYCLKLKNEKDPQKLEELKEKFQSEVVGDANEPDGKFLKEFIIYVGTPQEIEEFEETFGTEEHLIKWTVDDIKNALTDENPLKQNEAFLQAAVDMKNSKTFISREETIARIGPIMNTLQDHPAGEKFAMEVSELFKDLFEAQAQMEAEEDDLNLEEKVFDEKDLRQHFSKDNPMLNIPGFIDYCLKLKNENDPEKAEELKRIFISQILKENDPEMKYMQEFVTYTGTPEEIARFKEQNPIFSIDDIKKGLSDGNPLKDNEAFLQLAVLLKNETDEHKKLDLKSQIANFMNKFVQAQGQANFEIYGFEVMKLLGEPHEIAAVQTELQKRGFNV